MKIITSLQGALEIKSVRDLWIAQIGYCASDFARYPDTIPGSLASIQERERYLSDPPGADTWYTTAEALARGGDDCEGLTKQACSALIKRHWRRGKPLPALPAIAYFGGKVVHAVGLIHDSLALDGLERFLWRQRYPIITPRPAGYRRVLDMSFNCGMPFPARFAEVADLPSCYVLRKGNLIYCNERIRNV